MVGNKERGRQNKKVVKEKLKNNERQMTEKEEKR
jgi:hypothetical protein